MQAHVPPLFSTLSLACGAVLLAAGCAPVKYHTVPEGRPSAELVVAMPPGSSAYSYVILSAYEQPEQCLDSRLLPNSTANPGEPAINRVEAGRLQTVRMTLMRRGTNGHQWQCASMIGFLPESGVRYEINPLSQAWQCVPTLWRQGPDGARLPAEHKLRTPVASGFSTNTDGDCADRMVRK
ncbi:hypothetical protein [Limnohabitans sp.]|uniref:hypothetical protein n=1 Tax=Limnohabitans sp. TaxID=1907725 RepID=UPI0035AEB84C